MLPELFIVSDYSLSSTWHLRQWGIMFSVSSSSLLHCWVVSRAPLSISHAVHGEPFLLSFSSHVYMMRNWACIHPLSPQCKGTAARRRRSRRQPSSGMMKLERRWLSVTSIRSRSTALWSGLSVTPRLVWEYCLIHARNLWTLILFSLEIWVHFGEWCWQTVYA